MCTKELFSVTMILQLGSHIIQAIVVCGQLQVQTVFPEIAPSLYYWYNQ